MNRLFAACCVALLFGCSITEPTDLDTARVQSAVADDPSTPIAELANQLGVSELAIVRAMPDGLARRWQGAPEAAWSAIQDWPVVAVRSGEAAFLGSPASVFIKTDTQETIRSDRLTIDLRWQAVEEVWLIKQQSRDGYRGELAWFNGSGERVLRARVPMAGSKTDQSMTAFNAKWDALSP